MRRVPRLVPWASQAEWDEVYSCLYAPLPQLDRRSKGVNRVKAWAHRCRLPHAVESTAAFVEIGIRDLLAHAHLALPACPQTCDDSTFKGINNLDSSSSTQFTGNNGREPAVSLPLPTIQHIPQTSESELRMMFTMAMVRFVNGVCDNGQAGVYARSVSSLAQEVGLPLYFVDLRHAGTHDYLPSLTVLRNSVQRALRWLDENYWSLQRSFVVDVSREIKRLLDKYRKKKEKQDKENCLHTIIDILTEETYRDVLIPILVEKAYLGYAEDWDENSKIGGKLDKMWVLALTNFDQAWPDFTEDLCLEMVQRILDGHKASWCYVSWTKYLITTFWASKKKEGESSNLSRALLEMILRNPSPYTRVLLEEISQSFPDLKNTLDPFIDYSRLMTNNVVHTDINLDFQSENEMVQRLYALLEKFEGTSSVPGDNDEHQHISIQDGCWNVAKSWRPCPVGVSPVSIFSTNLELPLWVDNPNSGVYVASNLSTWGWDNYKGELPESAGRNIDASNIEVQDEDNEIEDMAGKDMDMIVDNDVHEIIDAPYIPPSQIAQINLQAVRLL